MLAELKTIDLFNLKTIFSPDNLFNTEYLAGVFIIFSIFPFITKAIIFFLKLSEMIQEKNSNQQNFTSF